jgi:hypothetical protein
VKPRSEKVTKYGTERSIESKETFDCLLKYTFMKEPIRKSPLGIGRPNGRDAFPVLKPMGIKISAKLLSHAPRTEPSSLLFSIYYLSVTVSTEA